MRTHTLERKTSTKTRFMSLVLALTMACTMLVALPSTASAGIITGSTIAVSPDIPEATLHTTAGQTLLVGGIPNADGSPGNFVTVLVPDPNDPGTVFGTDWTVAYLLDEAASEDPTAATVNKRTGLLTATAAGTVAIDVFLVDGQINQGNGVPDTAIQPPATIFVEIGDNDGEYGAQGNDQTVLMNTINGTPFTELLESFSGDSTAGFQNILDPLTPVNNNLAFNLTMAAGIGNRPNVNNFATFVAANAGDIQLTAADANDAPTGNVLAQLQADNSGTLNFVPAVAQSNTLTLNVGTAGLPSGSYVLRFTSQFQGAANSGRLLGVNVDFVFSI